MPNDNKQDRIAKVSILLESGKVMIPEKTTCKIGAHYDGVYKLEKRSKKEIINMLLEIVDIALEEAKNGK